MFRSFLLVFMVFAFVYSQEAVKEFQFEKMGLGMRVDELLKFYPQAKMIQQSDENIKTNVTQYGIGYLKSASVAFCFFLDKSLYSVILVYSSDFVSSVGGELNLYKAMVNRLGKDANITNTKGNVNKNDPPALQVLRKAEWDYPDRIDRFVTMSIMADESIVLGYRILSTDQVIRDRLLKQADMGF